MKYKGKEFAALIKQLKERRNDKDKTAYKKLMKDICKRFDCSDKTIYREMNKRKPGLRQSRSDAGKSKTFISRKEKLFTKELLTGGAKKTEVKKALAELTGKKSSARKLAKIADAALKMPDKKETNFGKNIKSFLERFFELQYWKEDKTKAIRLGTFKFEMTKDEVNDVILVLTNAYNRTMESIGKPPMKFDRLELMRSKLYNMLAFRLQMAEAEGSIKELESITDIYNKLKIKKVNLPLDFKVLEAIAKQLKPDITIDELISMLKDHAEN